LIIEAPEIVVVGASTGGLKALQTLLAGLAEDFPLPIVIVQHRGKESGSELCEFLRQFSRLPVSEPEDKEPILTGHAYLAPGDYHLMIEEGCFALSTESPVTYARPSIDVLFETAADEYQERTVGVILTGRNNDGTRGLGKIKARGGLAVVEDPASAACREMPESAVTHIKVDSILPLKEIAPYLNELVKSVSPNRTVPKDTL